MPIIKSAIKRVKQAEANRGRNVAAKRALRQAVKAFDAKPSAETLSGAHSEIDKAVKKNILEKNTAARRKASLAKKAKEAGVKIAAAKKEKPVAKAAAKPVAAKKPVAKTTAKKPVAKKASK